MKPSQRRSSLAYLLLLALTLPILAACGSTPTAIGPTATPVVITQLVNNTPQTIVVTAEPEPEVTPELTMKDTIIIGTWQEPASFLDYANSQAIRVELQLFYRPRWVTRLNFGYQPNPDLIDGDLPTFENGGAELVDVTVKPGEPFFDLESKSVIPATAEQSLKQMVVTGKIKSGLKWDDGESLTANDFVYAWQLNCSPDSQALDVTYCPLGSVPGAAGIVDKYEAKDDTTLVMTFAPGALDPAYQVLLFGPESDSGPQPQHLFGDMSAAEVASDERANGGTSAVPLGFGPYKMTEWKKGDSITFETNPHWPGEAPKTPNVIVKFFSDSVTVASALIAGDIDVTTGAGGTGLAIDQYPYLESVAKNGDINFEIDKNAASIELLQLNFNDPQDPTFKAPHPILSDLNVRKAIAMALDRKQMVDTIFFGQSSVLEQPQLPQMASYDPTLGKIDFDPEGASSLMEEAGWVDSDGDGIREKGGIKASLTLLTTSGNQLRQKSTQIIQSNLSDIGIELNLNYQPSSVVFSSDLLYGRVFEIIQYGNSFSNADAGNWWYTSAACSQIPLPENGMTGGNYSGWCDKDASDASTEANFETLDPQRRKAAWNTALQKYFENGYNQIPLFVKPNLLGTVPGMTGPKLDPTEYITWNAHTWVASEEAQ